MRRSVLAVVLTAVTALLASLTVSPGAATPVAIAPGTTPDTGTFSVDPATFTEGQSVKLAANFPNGTFTVTFFKKTGTDWSSIGTDESNSYGNAYLTNYEVNGAQEVYARITTGGTGRTEVKKLNPTPKVEPSANPTGSLSVSPAVFTKGQAVKVQANFPDGVFNVTLYRKSGDLWIPVGTDESSAGGNAYFSNYVVKGGEELFAQKSNGETTEVDTLTPTVIDPANFPNETGTISIDPAKKVYDGRSGTVLANFPNGILDVTVYKKDGDEWVSVGHDETSTAGNAYITGVKFDGPQEFFALASNGDRTNVRTLTAAPPNDVTGGPKTLGNNVVYVTTDNGGMPVTKGVDYEGKAVLETGEVPTETFDLETIAVRGNSSATKAKKPYKLKFEDKQKPFGMKSDKTWILLANYGDWTLVRSMVAWDLGKMLEGLQWTPTSTFAELFLNGKYLGSYQMVESIKIDKNRVPVNAETGQVIEIDPHWKEDGVPGFVGKSGLNYAWKDPDEFKTLDEEDCDKVTNPDCEDPEGLTTAKIAAMKKKIQNFETVLYGADGTKDWSKIHYSTLAPEDDWQTYLDLDSAVDYYLSREFTKDHDANFYRSNFFYTNNVDPNSVDPNDPNDPDKLFLGPIWDFDRSAGACTSCSSTIASPTGWWMRGAGSSGQDTAKIHWYTRIVKDPRFLKALHDRWAATKSVFAGVSAPGVSRAVTKLGGADSYALGKQVAANDRARWEGYGTRYHARSSTYTGELTWVRNWYADRYAWMDKELVKTPPPIPE
jgi:hypothetical protein